MKKSAKKISLSRETVLTLAQAETGKIAGGWGTIETQCCDTIRQCTIRTWPSQLEA